MTVYTIYAWVCTGTSTIFLWVRWGYFGRSGQLPDNLIAAHGHFSRWATTTSHTPALRSFSTQLFNYKNASSYICANTKGSDTTLLCKWIATACAGFTHEETDPQRRMVLSVILSASRLATAWFHLLPLCMLKLCNRSGDASAPEMPVYRVQTDPAKMLLQF